MATCTRVLILLSVMAVAATTAHARMLLQGLEYDCKEGCPAVTSPVCAKGDITLQSECLAFCQHLPVKHTGPCNMIDGSGVSREDAVAAAFAPASLSPESSTASAPLQISTAAMNRFRRDGFVCIGQAVGSPDFKPRRRVLRDGNMPSERPTPGPHFLRAIRVSTKDNLMYIEHSGDTAARLTAAAASAAALETSPGTPVTSVPGSIEAQISSADDGGRCFPMPLYGTYTPSDVTTAEVPADKLITYSAAFPYSAIGRLDINGGTCSASQIGDYTIVSAAHCIYDRETQKFATTNLRFEPATYRDSKGIRRYPYSYTYVSFYTYLTGFIKETDDRKAYWYDIVVLTLKAIRKTGYLGVRYNSAGFGGTINWGGYPSETQPTGTYRWGSCNIVNDGNGKDSRLVLRGNGVTCLILERGESGSPFFEKSGDQRYIRAVESHGETVNDVEIDVGTELDKVNYDFVLRNAANKPR